MTHFNDGNCPKNKIDGEVVKVIRDEYMSGETLAAIAYRHKRSRSTISRLTRDLSVKKKESLPCWQMTELLSNWR